MENPPFEDVFPIQDGDFPLLCLFTGGYSTFAHEINFSLHFECRRTNADVLEPETRVAGEEKLTGRSIHWMDDCFGHHVQLYI